MCAAHKTVHTCNFIHIWKYIHIKILENNPVKIMNRFEHLLPIRRENKLYLSVIAWKYRLESTRIPARKTAKHMKYELGCEAVDTFKTSTCLSGVVLHEMHKEKDELRFMEQQRIEVTHAYLCFRIKGVYSCHS